MTTSRSEYRSDGHSQRRKINDFIINFYATHGTNPTIRDVSKHMERTNNCIVGHFERMVPDGDIVRVSTGGNPKYLPPRLVEAIKKAALSVSKQEKNNVQKQP